MRVRRSLHRVLNEVLTQLERLLDPVPAAAVRAR